MGERYSEFMNIAWDLFLFEIRRTCHEEKVEFKDALSKTPFWVPRRGIRGKKKPFCLPLSDLEKKKGDIQSEIGEISKQTKGYKSIMLGFCCKG